MKKQEKNILKEKENQEINEIIAYMNTYINKTDMQINKLINILKEIKKIAERNQYGNTEVSLRLIKQKLKEVTEINDN